MAEKRWYRYTDESGNCWRIRTSEELAEVGGLQAVEADECKPVPERIKPRYIWLAEATRPKDRLPVRVKAIIERGRLKEIWGKQLRWDIGGKEMAIGSYYGEVVSL